MKKTPTERMVSEQLREIANYYNCPPIAMLLLMKQFKAGNSKIRSGDRVRESFVRIQKGLHEKRCCNLCSKPSVNVLRSFLEIEGFEGRIILENFYAYKGMCLTPAFSSSYHGVPDEFLIHHRS